MLVPGRPANRSGARTGRHLPPSEALRHTRSMETGVTFSERWPPRSGSWPERGARAGRRTTSRRLGPGCARDAIGRRPGGSAGRRGWHLRRRSGARSRQTTSMPGHSASQTASVSASRSEEGRRATWLDVEEHGSVDTALALAVPIHANHAGYCGGGVRQRGDQPQQGLPPGTLKASIIRAPARPASAGPTDTSIDRSRSVRRPNLRVGPGTCSAKDMRSQDSSSPTNLRTRNDTSTNLPAVGRSRGNRR